MKFAVSSLVFGFALALAACGDDNENNNSGGTTSQKCTAASGAKLNPGDTISCVEAGDFVSGTATCQSAGTLDTSACVAPTNGPGNGNGNDNNNNNNNNAEGKAELCGRFCTKQLDCLGQICAEGLSTVEQCTTQCVGAAELNLTEADVAEFEAGSCDEINGAICTQQPDIQTNCTCPELGTCEGTQTCVPLQNGETVCVENNAAPAGAPTCDNATPCTESQVCVAFEANATSGSCLEYCQ